MRVLQLRALVLAQDYRVDPQLVAEALLQRVRGGPDLSDRADARSPSAGQSPPGH
jgi:hypothetical protein